MIKKFEEMSEQEKYDFLNEMIRRDGLETYEDYAGICKRMSVAASCMYDVSDDLDEVEKSNLLSLSKLLSVCAEMFIVCDDYYRYGKLARENRPERFRDAD